MHDYAKEILSIKCPLKRYKQREVVTPWVTADIYRNIRYRDSLVNLYRLTKNNLYLKRNIVNSMIDSAKKVYISSLLDRNASSPKKFWKHINDFLKGKYVTHHYPCFLDPVTNTEVPLGQESTFLNEFFCGISTRLGFDSTDHVTYTDNDYLDIYENVNGVFDLKSEIVTEQEILICIKVLVLRISLLHFVRI